MKTEATGRDAARQNKIVDPKHVNVDQGHRHGSSIHEAGKEYSAAKQEPDVEGARQLQPLPAKPEKS